MANIDDVIGETKDPILAAIENAVEENSAPTEEQAEVAAEAEKPAEDATEKPVDEAPEGDKPKVEDEDAAIKALEAELVSKTPTLQRGRISVSRHQAVLTRNRNKWDEEKKTFEQKVKEFESKLNDPQTQRKLEMLQLAETDAPRFFAAMKATPAYAALIKAEAEALAKTSAPAAPEPKVAADPSVPTEEPQPDVLLADGRVTYSPEQALALAKWTSAQIQGKFTAELDKVRGEFKPIVEERRHKEAIAEATGRLEKLIAKASAEWPGFKENAAAIGAEIRKPENIAAGMSLHEAYIKVVPAQLAKQQATAQAEADKKAVEKLQQRVPKETIRPGSPAAVKTAEKEGPVDLESIIKASIRNAGLTAA